MAEVIRIVVDEDGTSTVSVDGVKGKSCTELTASLERELGKPESRKLTGEYYEKAEQGRIKSSAGGGY